MPATRTSLLNKLLYVDTKTYLHELLMKQDQMSMAASIESRVPFLDHELVEFAARMPEHMKVRGMTTKYVLRQAMAKACCRRRSSRGERWGFRCRWARGSGGRTGSCSTRSSRRRAHSRVACSTRAPSGAWWRVTRQVKQIIPSDSGR